MSLLFMVVVLVTGTECTDPDFGKGALELIESKGYPAEGHTVVTADGYILTLHRIPWGIRGQFGGHRPGVFLQHGILMSSCDWVNNFPHQSLGFILADAGYDVWMGNTRGNTYSKRHVTLSPEDDVFWRFSWSEMGIYDLPASLDYVLAYTGQQSLFYVGHSLGTTSIFALLSRLPEYNSKIRAVIAMAPIVNMKHSTSSIRILVPPSKIVAVGFRAIRLFEILPISDVGRWLAEVICGSDLRFLCVHFLFSMSGYDAWQLNQTRLPVYFSNFPAGTSAMNLVHCSQMFGRDDFQDFSYTRLRNLQRYHQSTPPNYDLENVHAPVALFWGDKDLVSTAEDASALLLRLPNPVLGSTVPLARFTHSDFVWGTRAADFVYPRILQIFAMY